MLYFCTVFSALRLFKEKRGNIKFGFPTFRGSLGSLVCATPPVGFQPHDLSKKIYMHVTLRLWQDKCHHLFLALAINDASIFSSIVGHFCRRIFAYLLKSTGIKFSNCFLNRDRRKYHAEKNLWTPDSEDLNIFSCSTKLNM